MRRKRRSGRSRGWWERPSSSDDDQDTARGWCDERAGGDDLRRAGRLRADGRRRQWRAPRDPDVLVHRRARPECPRRRSARHDLRGRGGRGGHAPARAPRGVAWRAAVLDGVPVDRPGDGTRVFASGDGALLVGEVALLARPETVGVPRQRRFGIGRGRARPYGGKLAIGAWYYTARFSDLVDTLPNGASVQHRGSGGVYLIGDLTVRSLTAFAQLGLGDCRVNQIGGYLGGGFTFTAPFSR